MSKREMIETHLEMEINMLSDCLRDRQKKYLEMMKLQKFRDDLYTKLEYLCCQKAAELKKQFNYPIEILRDWVRVDAMTKLENQDAKELAKLESDLSTRQDHLSITDSLIETVRHRIALRKLVLEKEIALLRTSPRMKS